MMTRSKIIAVFAGVVSLTSASAQELPRRSFLGIKMENVTPDLRRIIGIRDTIGVLINDVISGSTAAEAGFQKGDILLRINGQEFNEVAQVVAYVAGQPGNTPFSYELIRNRKSLRGNAVFKAYPEEHYPDLDVVYTAAKGSSGLQRIIITKKRTIGKGPLIIFLGGIGCYSLDVPFDTGRSEVQLMNKLARNGFITARIEKPGMGDNAGHSRSCSEISFLEEAESYTNSIESLKKRSDVDSTRIFLIGHSIGGVMAPLVAAKTAIKGVVAYGTMGSNFIEYLIKTRRTIAAAYGWTPDETDLYIKEYCECALYYFAEKMSSEQAANKNRDCGTYLSVFDLRSRKYNDELYDLNIPETWKNYAAKALFLWGSSDYISSREDHEILAATVNTFHPGNGSFIQIDNADHGMQRASSFAASRTQPGRYNDQVGEIILTWLKQQIS